MAGARIAWVDYARAYGIVLVVTGHAFRALERADGLTVDPALLALVDKVIYSFHMPFFFLLAGMTKGLSSARRPSQVGWSLLVTLVWPYLLWSLVLIGLKHLFTGLSSAELPTTDLLRVLYLQPVDQFWFLYSLFLIRLAWIAVDAIGNRILSRLAVLVPLTLAFVDFGQSSAVLGVWLLFWAAFYGLGTLLTPASLERIRPSRRLALALVAGVVWVVGLIWSTDLLDDNFGVDRTGIALAGSLMSLLLLSLLPSSERGFARLVGLIGEASLAIYAAQSIGGVLMRVALAKAGLLTPASLVIGYSLAALLLPTLAYAVLLWLSARWKLPLISLAGFGMARRSAYFPALSKGGSAPMAQPRTSS
ncbi:acyltransferase family protein [Oryzibacter oryziterrae]|uniref:acyltransferase family protein n=1 Tax=Oryzibacter oryziterrae TaxID=2766474 RepID=UPI001EFF825E|nr:acyltransferase family protein [Oryzibacter oryziterrae]